jgi:hypothetical protein
MRALAWQIEHARRHRSAQACAFRLIFRIKLNNKSYLPENVGKLFCTRAGGRNA